MKLALFLSFFKNINWYKNSIRARLTVQFLLLVGILFLLFSIGIYFFGKLYIQNRFYKKLQDRAVLASTIYFDFNVGQYSMLSLLGRRDAEILKEEMISIYDIKRKLFILSTDLKREKLHKSFLKSYDEDQFIVENSDGRLQFVALSIKDKADKYLVCISAFDDSGEKAMTDLRNILSILSLVALILIGFQGWYFAQKALEPISNIREQLDFIFPANISKRISHSAPEDEIGKLSRTLNDMLSRAEKAAQAQKLFVANVSHELKNPLTKIFTQIELMELKHKENAAVLNNIMSLKSDTKSLINLNEVILNLANSYTLDASIPMEILRLDELIIAALEECKRWYPNAEVVFQMNDIPDDEDALCVLGNQDALSVVLKNLIDNAIKFSDNKPVKVSSKFGQMYIEIFIENEGRPIPQDQIKAIFQAFYRADATAKGKKGHGIGLAVVKQILELHQAKIEVSSDEQKTVFSLTFKNRKI
jgi:signal transduction histidine kinase